MAAKKISQLTTTPNNPPLATDALFFVTTVTPKMRLVRMYDLYGVGFPYYIFATGGALQSRGAFVDTGSFVGNVTGNARGAGAMDLQTFRDGATKVASGRFTANVGRKNTVSQDYACAAGDSIIIQTSAQYCAAVGQSITISAAESAGLPGTSIIINSTATNSLVCGQVPGTATGAYTTTWGQRAVADKHGQRAHGGAFITSNGDSQHSFLDLFKQTTNNSSTNLLLDGSGATVKAILPNNTTWYAKGLVVARRVGVTENDAFLFEACIKRDANAASTAAAIAFPAVTQLGATTWTVAITADTTNGALNVAVTGENSKTINWHCLLEIVEAAG